MKLSKRLAAAFIAICMLLVSLPAFAANISIANDKMVLPTDGSAVAITSTGLGHANSSIGIVIDSASAAALGLQLSELPKTTTKTAGTNYDGLMISGTIKARNLTYVPGATSGTAKNVREMFENNELVQFDFVDAYVKSLRANNAGTAVVLEIAYQEYMDSVVPGTAKKLAEGKITGEETESVTFTEDDLYTLTDEECATLKGLDYRSNGAADFYGASSDGLLASNLTAKAGADYKTDEVIDTGVFPEGTIFIASTKMVSNGATISGVDWGYKAYSKASPEGTYVAQASGDYVVYALKTGYDTSSGRYVKATINGAELRFTQENVPDAANNKNKNFYWQKDVNGNVITLSKGALINVSVDATATYARAAGLALVPASGAAAVDAAVPAWQSKDTAGCLTVTQEQLDKLHDFTAIEFVAPPAITRTINVNGTAYEVSSDDAETVVTASIVDFDAVPIAGVTVLDAIVKAGIVTDSNYLKKVAIKLNGIQVYEPAKFIVSEEDVITTTEITTVDVTNFTPVRMSDVLSLIGGNDGGMKICFDKNTLPSSAISFIHDGSDYVDDSLKDAKLVGYLEVNKEITKSYTDGDVAGTTVTIPVGGKAYVIGGYFNGRVIRSSTYGLQSYGLSFANQGTAPLHVTLPDGTVTQHPKYVQQSGYTFASTYITNSNTTNKVDARFVETTGKWQLFTDGGAFICVIKYTVDENGKLAEVVSQEPHYLLVNKPLSVELNDDERAMVWGYAPYAGVGTGGTTMVPMTGIIANPAN